MENGIGKLVGGGPAAVAAMDLNASSIQMPPLDHRISSRRCRLPQGVYVLKAGLATVKVAYSP